MKQLEYKDLVQLVIFPDGSPLSSRLKNAALLQEVFKKPQKEHEQALAAGKRMNGQVSYWIQQQLRDLHEGRASWVPRFNQPSSPAAVQEWKSRAARQLELLLHDGLENLVGFRGELKLEVVGFTPLQQQQQHHRWRALKTEWRMLTSAPHQQPQQVSCAIVLEDAAGEAQGNRVTLDITTNDGANNRCILEVTSEDSIIRLQVFAHGENEFSTNKELLGELRVPLTCLPNIGAETDLSLPVYQHRSYLPDASVPVYKPHRDQVVLPDEQEYIHVGHLQCFILYTTDAPQPKLGDAPASASGRSSSGLGAIVRSKTQLAKVSAAAHTSKWAWSETAKQDQARAAAKARWVHAVNMIIANIVVEKLRNKANQEVLKAMSESAIFGSQTVEKDFCDLTREVWDAWSAYAKKGESCQPPGIRTRSLDSLPTMISPSLGGVDYHQQPLYYILQHYDRHLKDLMKDEKLVNQYIPGMPFFHILFIYAMLRGVSPWFMKLCMIRQTLMSLQTAGYSLLRFVTDVLSEVEIARTQQLLTEFEARLHGNLKDRFQQTIKWMLEKHTDVFPPEDAAARKLVLGLASRELKHLQQPGQLVNLLNSLAVKRMQSQLNGCDVHKVDHAISIVRNSESYEDVRSCCSALGQAWSECARDFEAYLSLKIEAKAMLADWHVRSMIMKHYEHLARATKALIHGFPSWPYHPELGFHAEDLQKLQDGLEEVNKLMLKFGLVRQQRSLPHSHGASAPSDAANGKSDSSAALPAAGQPINMYEVKVFTGTLKGAGTDSQVFIDIRGNVKASGRNALTRERLKNKKESSRLFQSGSVDVFMVPVRGGLGALTEIELSTDGEDAGHSWYVDRVEVTDKTTKQVYCFDCQAWLSKTRPPCMLEKVFGLLDLPAATETTYRVEVMTSNELNAGTDANVFIQLKGSAGEMKTIEYLKRKRKTDFNRSHHAQFTIKCGYIGNVTEILLGIQPTQGTQQSCFHSGSHQTKKQNMSWCLDHLIITNTKNNAKWLFKPGNNGWFHPNSKEYSQKLTPCEETQYRVIVRTADEHAASLERGHVWIQLHGTAKTSGILVLKDPLAIEGCEQNARPFQRGQEDYFSVYWEDLGELTHLRIGHDGKSVRSMLGLGNKTAWFVSHVKVVDVTNSEEYTFPVGCKLTEKMPEKEVSCHNKHEAQIRKVVTYKVWVHTSNKNRAGTDAHVSIEIFGENRTSTGRRQLVDRSRFNLFEAGQVDEFTIQCSDLGTLEKLEIGHDNTGFGASWHLDKVEVLDTNSGRKYVFGCGEWLKAKAGTQRTLFPEHVPRTVPTSVPGSPSSSSSTSSLPQTAPRLELLDWIDLMQQPVEKQINHVNSTRDRFTGLHSDQASTSRGDSAEDWEPVSRRQLHSKKKVEMTLGISNLIDALSNDVVRNITHGRLRSQVAQRVLLKVIQPAATRVMKHLQQACFQELQKVRLPTCSDGDTPTIFELSPTDLQSLCYRLNTLLHHCSVVHAKLEEFGRDASIGRLTPADRGAVLQETERVLRDSRSRSGSVLAELRKAIRYSFAVMLEDRIESGLDGAALLDELKEYMTDLSVVRIAECWLSGPEAQRFLYDLCWSSLLEAVQCQLLGLSIWSLGLTLKFTTEQALMTEAALKLAELSLTEQNSFNWAPQQSVAEVTADDKRPYLRGLLEAAQEDSDDLYHQMLEQSREILMQEGTFDGQPDLPYFGTEVVATQLDLQTLQQPVRKNVCVLDLARILRSREVTTGRAGHAARVEEYVKGLHARQQMQVLFGLPIEESQSATYSVHLTHKHPTSPSDNRATFHVSGQLYVFCFYVTFTTLVQVGPSTTSTHTPAGLHKDALKYSDYTAVWRAPMDILHVEMLSTNPRLIMTLADHSVVQLSLQAEANMAGLTECYQKICKAKGIA